MTCLLEQYAFLQGPVGWNTPNSCADTHSDQWLTRVTKVQRVDIQIDSIIEINCPVISEFSDFFHHPKVWFPNASIIWSFQSNHRRTNSWRSNFMEVVRGATFPVMSKISLTFDWQWRLLSFAGMILEASIDYFLRCFLETFNFKIFNEIRSFFVNFIIPLTCIDTPSSLKLPGGSSPENATPLSWKPPRLSTSSSWSDMIRAKSSHSSPVMHLST